MDRKSSIRGNMLEFYNTGAGSVTGAIIDSISHEIELTDENISAIDDLLGISSTPGNELDARWGTMLNMPRKYLEHDEIYRNRLKLAFNVDSGGTISSIKKAVATVLGIEGNQVAIDKRVVISDSWEYDGEFLPQITVGPGHAVCVVDLDNQLFDKYGNVTDAIKDAIINAKSIGVTIHTFIINFRLLTYRQMEELSYRDLGGVKYNQLGGVDTNGNLYRYVEVV